MFHQPPQKAVFQWKIILVDFGSAVKQKAMILMITRLSLLLKFDCLDAIITRLILAGKEKKKGKHKKHRKKSKYEAEPSCSFTSSPSKSKRHKNGKEKKKKRSKELKKHKNHSRKRSS
ncbi:hypothetical protein D918_02757 [Trichuris suis]|nr:hypothetical protein D918_02757 [Trichuris suis]